MVDIEAECERLERERDKLAQQIQRSRTMLDNENFVTRARPDVVERERKALDEYQTSLTQLEERIASLCH